MLKAITNKNHSIFAKHSEKHYVFAYNVGLLPCIDPQVMGGYMLITHIKLAHWLPRFLKVGAICLGRTIYVNKPVILRTLFLHEITHRLRFSQYGTLRFLKHYVVEWWKAGRNYRKNPYEKEAYYNQESVKRFALRFVQDATEFIGRINHNLWEPENASTEQEGSK